MFRTAFRSAGRKDYFYDAIAWALENNVTNGTSATFSRPDMVCTRAQIVTFLYRSVNK